jgi:hypothetical protein
MRSLARLIDMQVPAQSVEDQMAIREASDLSHSLLNGFLILACPSDGSNLTLRAAADRPSAAHRYVRRLIAVGPVTQDPETRRYGRAVAR